MARTHNICGMPPNYFETKFNVYETATTRGPVFLGGPRYDGQGLAFEPGDRMKCFKVHVRRAWAPGTYWLALHHANGHWASWPCIMGAEVLKERLRAWHELSEIRWAPESDESAEFNYPRIRHYGAKSFQPGNTVSYVRNVCLSLLRRERQFSFTLRSYPHTVSAGNSGDSSILLPIDLMSAVPYSVETLKAFCATLMELNIEMVPEKWVSLKETQWTKFINAMGGFFAGRGAPLLADAYPNIAEAAPELRRKAREDAFSNDPEATAMRLRLRRELEAAKEEDVGDAASAPPSVQPFEDSPEPDDDEVVP